MSSSFIPELAFRAGNISPCPQRPASHSPCRVCWKAWCHHHRAVEVRLGWLGGWWYKQRVSPVLQGGSGTQLTDSAGWRFLLFGVHALHRQSQVKRLSPSSEEHPRVTQSDALWAEPGSRSVLQALQFSLVHQDTFAGTSDPGFHLDCKKPCTKYHPRKTEVWFDPKTETFESTHLEPSDSCAHGAKSCSAQQLPCYHCLGVLSSTIASGYGETLKNSSKLLLPLHSWKIR